MSLRENDKTTNHIQCLSLFASFYYFYFHFDLIFKQLFSQQMGPITVSTPGKIILLGEHSVVYGNSAFASSLSDLRINITLVCSSVLTTILDVIERNNKTPSYHDLPWFYKYKPQGRLEMVCILRSRLASSIVPRKGFVMYFSPQIENLFRHQREIRISEHIDGHTSCVHPQHLQQDISGAVLFTEHVLQRFLVCWWCFHILRS